MSLPTQTLVQRAVRRGAVASILLCALASCGEPSYHTHEGFVLVDNRADVTTSEFMLAFRLSPFGHPFTGNPLASDLAPGSTANLGTWQEEYYDAEADLELGDLVEWFDLFVGDQQTTVFEAQ
ncbi:MAG: hypothetical protein O2894_02300 [Planctomycetota bacterium]|nr:hypothetical protein [Planctomycetota bacterium]